MKKIQWTKRLIAMVLFIAVGTTAAIIGAVRRIPEKAAVPAQTQPTAVSTELTEPPTETTEAPTEAPTETQPFRRIDATIYINLPTDTPSWVAIGEDLRMLFQLLSYRVSLDYAGGDSVEQAAQIAQAVEKAVSCIIIAPVESAALCEAAELAKTAGIPMISYDRLLYDTDAALYHVTYDYTQIGAALGEHIVEKKRLGNLTPESPLRMELFMGSPESTTSLELHTGLMEVLQPHLDSGDLTVPSGYIAFEDTCIPDQDPETAQTLLKRHLKEYYKRKQFPDIICTVSQSVADACIQVLEDSGCPEESWPLITVVDGSTSAHWETGKISVSVNRNTQQLNECCVTLTDDLLTGKTPQADDSLTYFNNVTVVPAVFSDFAVTLPPEPVVEETQPTEETEKN